ncbi:MAG: hypothetical protein JSR97_12530 [Verrucomicrobia bacterium]|nr:hypothetical protein [Verrucomicrobiota bacterium]
MALDKDTLEQAILSIMDNMAAREDNPGDAREYFAEQLSNAIDAFVRSGKVDVTVTTTGTATNHTGTGTGAVT